MRHGDLPPRPKEQENQQHVQVKPGIERRRNHITVPLPHLEPLPIRPVHHHIPSDNRRRVPRTQIPVEHRQPREEDTHVPEIDAPARQESMQAVQRRRQQRTQQKRPGERAHLAFLEELGWPDDGVLHAEGIRGDERLAGPLVQRVGLGAGEDVALGGQDPAHDGIVYGDAEDGAEDLREEDGARGDVHVVPDFLVLEHVLRAVPGVAGDGTVGEDEWQTARPRRRTRSPQKKGHRRKRKS